MRAAIDVGSNSLLLTVMRGEEVLHDEVRIVGLGRGLGEGGRMEPARRRHGFQVLSDYVRIARGYGVAPERIRAAATSGARRAHDAAELFDALLEATGLEVRTISGEEEARLSWLGGLSGLQLEWPVLLVDMGGGSTELVLGRSPLDIAWRSSREYGAVRLQEGFGADLRAMAQAVDRDLEALPLAAERVVAVAGTATMFGALELGLERWEGDRIHGLVLTREQLSRWRDRFHRASPDEAADLAALAPQRAPYLAGGAMVLDRVMANAGVEELTLSNGGLRFGLLQG